MLVRMCSFIVGIFEQASICWQQLVAGKVGRREWRIRWQKSVFGEQEQQAVRGRQGAASRLSGV